TAVSFSGPWHTLPVDKFSFLEQVMFQPTALMAQIEYFPKLLTKTHNANFMYKGWALLPAALTSRVILVVRDPRDVAISQAAHFGVSLDESIAGMADVDRLIGGEHP